MEAPALEYLLGTYFHQDFYVDHGGVWETVDAFMARDPHYVAQLPREVDELLRTEPTEEELLAYVQRTGCTYWADPDAGGYRGWFTELACRVREATTTPAFWQFAGAHLHQDWPEEYGDPWRALAAFVRDEPTLAASMSDEIEQALRKHRSEGELAAFVDGQGATYVPGPADGGYRGWLTELARRLRETTSD